MRAHATDSDLGYDFTPELPQEVMTYLELWRAVLHLGVADAHTQFLRRRELEANHGRAFVPYEAETWMASDSMDVGAFAWICELLGMDPEVVRNKVIAVRRGAISIRRW